MDVIQVDHEERPQERKEHEPDGAGPDEFSRGPQIVEATPQAESDSRPGHGGQDIPRHEDQAPLTRTKADASSPRKIDGHARS